MRAREPKYSPWGSVLSYALFPQVAKKFFDVRDGRGAPAVEAAPAAAPAKKEEKKASNVGADGVRTLYVQDVSIQ